MKRKRKTKTCIGCGDKFLTFKNYDYCPDCAVNNSRYLNQNSPCSECDGSGVIKFPRQKARNCKLCYLNRENMKLTKTEKYWKEVDLLAQEKIYQLFTTNIPFQNIKLITEPWKFEDRQMKLSGLFLDRDIDYRTLLADMEDQYSEELPDKEVLAEEIVLWYCRLVIKALISEVSDYSGYDFSFFDDLTAND